MTTYLQPTSTQGFPGGLSLTQFIQTVMVGISGLPGQMVRPKWQVAPPKNPDIDVNWMAIGIDIAAPDANAFIGVNDASQTIMQRHETLDIGCSIYGPDALEIYGLLRDGFQIPQNLIELRYANMGFVEILPARKIPDLVNERFVDRIQTSVFLRREIQRVYPIPTLLSANGVIHCVLTEDEGEYLLDWNTQNVED